MLRTLVLFCVMYMISPSSSILCDTYYRFSDQVIGNCSGDACVTYIYDGSVNMIGCASNVLFSNRTGCYDDVDGNVICSCQSSNYCNNYTLDELVHVDIAPKMSCFGLSASMCKGLACTVERVNNESYDKCGLLAPTLDLVELQANLIVFDQTTKEGHNEDDLYFNYLGGDFRANCMTTKCVQLAQKLRIEGLKSKKPQVKCHSYVFTSYNNLTCSGDFCYYQTVYGAVNRGCISVEDKLAERKLTVGTYEYFMESIYLCNEDFCNEDEYAARDNRSPDMGRSFTWPPLDTFETTTDGVSESLSIILSLMFSFWMLLSV